MANVALLAIPIEQQEWAEVEVDQQPLSAWKLLFGGPQQEKKRETRLQNVIRWHTFWGAEVPYLTDFLSIFNQADGPERRDAILQDALAEQITFLNRLAQNTTHDSTLELRYLFQPAQQCIQLVFIGKVVGPDKLTALSQARDFWQQFESSFPGKLYGLAPIADMARLNNLLNFQANHLVEFRRSEKLEYLGGRSQGYVVYPIQGAPNSMNHLLQTLHKQTQPYLISICLKPTQLFPVEKQHLAQIASYCRELQQGRTDFSVAAGEVADIYTNYLRQLKTTFLFRISVASPQPIHPELLSGLSTDLAHPLKLGEHGHLLPNEAGHFVKPQTQHEYDLAQTNLQYLEFSEWGEHFVDPPLPRLRYLVDPTSATSAFRIPIPPLGGLPGIESRPLLVVNQTSVSINGDRNIGGDVNTGGGHVVFGDLIVQIMR